MWRSLVVLSRLVTRASLWGPSAGAPCRALRALQKMRRACLRLRVKGIRCSCRTAFAVERDILARVVPSRASSMGPTSSIPHGNKCAQWRLFAFVGIFRCRGRRRVWVPRKGLATLSIRIRGYGIWGCSIAPNRVSAEVRVKIAAFVTDTISIRAANLL